MRRFPILVLALAVTAPLGAQSTLDSACVAPEHRQFDFWLGSWTVVDTTGRVVGTSEVRPIAGSCGLREEWQGRQGSTGTSLNVWQPALRYWTQFWIGAGVVLRLTGGLEENGRMVLAGERMTAEGKVIDRISWRALPRGEVRQTWSASGDGGKSWRPLFDGLYRPRDNARTSIRPATSAVQPAQTPVGGTSHARTIP